jgi:hypothetical protein
VRKLRQGIVRREQKWEEILEARILPAFPKPWASYCADRGFEDYIKSSGEGIDLHISSSDKASCFTFIVPISISVASPSEACP